MAETWRVIIARDPQRYLLKLPRNARERLVQAIDALAMDPRPHDCVKLTARNLYRIRRGGWRIIYAVRDAELVVLVVEVGPRGDVYRRV